MPPLQQHDTTQTTGREPADADAPSAPTRDWQRASLIIGGVLFAVGNMLHPLQHSDSAYEAATWEAAHLTIFFSIPMLVLGLPFLHRRLTARIDGRLATIAVSASIAGLIGIAPGTIIETFVAPMIGHEAMTELESGGFGAVNAVLGSAYLCGSLSLGWVVRKARLLPRWAGPALIASTVALVAVMGSTSAAAGVVIIVATSVYGLTLSALALRAGR
jgi:hypothetical protein